MTDIAHIALAANAARASAGMILTQDTGIFRFLHNMVKSAQFTLQTPHAYSHI